MLCVIFVVLGCVVFKSCSFVVLFRIYLVLCCGVEEICRYMYFFYCRSLFQVARRIFMYFYSFKC